MGRRVKSQGLGVATLFTPLSVSMDIVNISGVPARQWYYATGLTWSPNYAITPLILKPVVTAVNPDTGRKFQPAYTSVLWMETTPAGAVTEFTSASGVPGYSVASDGTLTMTKNVPAGTAGLTLTCVVTYSDDRRGINEKIEQTFTIGQDRAADENYKILLTPPHQYFNPLDANDSPVKTITAKAFLGEREVTSSVRFFWYYLHNNQEVLIEDNPSVADAVDPCLAYVSGQYTGTLTVNADYEAEDLTFVCRIASSASLSAPDVPNVSARATLRWRIPPVKGIVLSPNGDTARQSIMKHQFGVIYRQGGRDVDAAVSQSRIVKKWSRKRTDSATVTQLGTGETCEVMESNLINNAGVQVNVQCEGYVLSPYKAVVHDNAVVTHTENGVTYVVVGRDME